MGLGSLGVRVAELTGLRSLGVWEVGLRSLGLQKGLGVWDLEFKGLGEKGWVDRGTAG